ncbi:E3 ubiquitin-protein ligase RNF14-like [Nematolebias whitei]|uniref:E3 ubiquitin-protein ligase RNF14-like n=1 Tax=Nematolebias whitei TaxID=451745 RepID=UPI0018981F68|nr:E3 ubiquitin-protein ligase RNF14-like [Nematolebias whitei]
MNTDLEEQKDELLALQSIFGSEEFVRKESEFAGEIRVPVDLPVDFNVVLNGGQYEISFLPPVLLTFELPVDYPSSAPPSFSLTCIWLTPIQLASLRAQLIDLYKATEGAVVLFSWIQFLREDALKLLSIHNLLELPSDQPSTLPEEQDKHDPDPSPVEDNKNTPKSESIDVSDPCGSDKSVSPDNILLNVKADNQNVLSLRADTSELLPFSEFVQINKEDVSNKSDISTSVMATELTSSPVQPTKIPLNNEKNSYGIFLTPSQKLLSQILIYDVEQKQKVFATTVFNCGVCYMDWLGSECVQLYECGHIFCRACLSNFYKVQITEGTVQNVICPQESCTVTPIPPQVKSLVGEELFSRYERLLLQSTLDRMPDVTYCPRSSCGSPVISEKSSSVAMCSVCSFAFCVNCKKTYHGNNKCYEEEPKTTREDFLLTFPQSKEGRKALQDDYAAGSRERRKLLKKRYGKKMLQFFMTDLSEEWKAVNTKACPGCHSPIQKDGGCCVMRCIRCWMIFLWPD